MDKPYIIYIRYSGRLSEDSDYKVGDTEVEEIPQSIARKGYPITVILPGTELRKSKYYLRTISPLLTFKFVPIRYRRGKGFSLFLFNILSFFEFLRMHKRIHRTQYIIHFFPHTVLSAILIKTVMGNKVKLVSQFYDINARPVPLWKVIEKIAVIVSDVIIANSHWISLKIRDVTKSKKIYIIPPGVNLELFEQMSPINLQICPLNSIRIVYIGTLEKLRNLSNILPLIYLINKYFPVCMVFIGEGDGKEDIIKQSKNLRIEKIVKVIPPVEYSDIPRYLKYFNVGISYIPKRYYYSPPLKTLEYLAANLVVIGTNTFGNLLLIKDGFNGIIIHEEISQEDVKKILDTLNSPKKLKKLKINSKITISHHTWEKRVEKYIRVYTTLGRAVQWDTLK